jgi:hypothetical protein
MGEIKWIPGQNNQGYYFDYRLLWNNVCNIIDYLKAREND